MSKTNQLWAAASFRITVMTPSPTIPSIIRKILYTIFSPDSMARGDRESCVCPGLMAHHILSALQPQAWMQNYILTCRAQRMPCQVVMMLIACREAPTILMLTGLRACEEAIMAISKAIPSGAWFTLDFTLWLHISQWAGTLNTWSPLFSPEFSFRFYLLTDSIASHLALIPVALIAVITVFRSTWDKAYSKPTRSIRQRSAQQKVTQLYWMKFKR